MTRLEQGLSDAKWTNEPDAWSLKDDVLTIETGKDTDFWQDTFYGFHRDDGHFLGRELQGDFTAVLTFAAEYQVLYDQAGLMVRINREDWIKTGVEHSDGVTNFSTVVTRDGHSDWSVFCQDKLAMRQRIRLTRVGGAIISHFMAKTGHWQLLRLANFEPDVPVLVGPMACSPQRSGLVARFFEFEIGPAIDDPLHNI